MKRRDLLKLVGVSGVLPFVGGRDESPKSESLIIEDAPLVATHSHSGLIGSAHANWLGSHEIAGTGAIWGPHGFHNGDGWAIDVPSFDGDV